MSNFAIVTDSSCGLPPTLVQKYDIKVVPVLLEWQGRLLRDGVDIAAAEVYEYLRSHPEAVIKSTTPTPEDFARVYEEALASQGEVLSIHVAGKLTSVVEVARQAARVVHPTQIQIVDSDNASMGLGFAVLAAARAREAGADINEGAREAVAVGSRARLLGLLETLKYVRSSGRLVNFGAKAGSALRLRPLILVEKGEVHFQNMVRTRSRGIAKLIDWVEQEARGRPLHAAVVHAAALSDALGLAAMVRERVECTEMLVSEFTPVLGGHTGPGFLGVACYSE